MKFSAPLQAAAFSLVLLGGQQSLPAKPGRAAKPAAAPVLIVQGTIKAIARTPRPETVPYKNSVTEIHLVNIKALQGKLPAPALLIYMQGMKAKKWMPAATYKSGQVIKLTLQPWEKVEHSYGSMQRHALSIEDVGDLPEYWGEPAK